MLPRRVYVLALVLLSVGGAITLAQPQIRWSQLDAQAQQSPPVHGQRHGLIQELNMTPAQIRQMQAIRKQYKDPIAQRAAQLRQAQQELQVLIASTDPGDKVRQQHDQVKALQQQLGDLRFESMLATRQILNPDQRRKFVEYMQKQQQKSQKLANKNQPKS